MNLLLYHGWVILNFSKTSLDLHRLVAVPGFNVVVCPHPSLNRFLIWDILGPKSLNVLDQVSMVA